MGKLGKRQMIVIGVMVIVIIFAVIDYFLPKKKASMPGMTKKTVELNTFVTDLTAGLAKDTTGNLNAFILSRAEKDWKRDPFLDAKSYRSWSKAREPSKVVAAAPKIEFTYTGYLGMNRERMAIINGMEYREGEELEVKGFVLRSVSPTRVIIENRVARSVQTIPLQE